VRSLSHKRVGYLDACDFTIRGTVVFVDLHVLSLPLVKGEGLKHQHYWNNVTNEQLKLPGQQIRITLHVQPWVA
jgi:hypothetical protein